MKNLASGKIDSYKGSVHIFTDASKTIDNKTSAAFWIPEFNIEHSVRLTDNITIFAAELCAIKLALQWVISNSDKNVTKSQKMFRKQAQNKPNIIINHNSTSAP